MEWFSLPHTEEKAEGGRDAVQDTTILHKLLIRALVWIIIHCIVGRTSIRRSSQGRILLPTELDPLSLWTTSAFIKQSINKHCVGNITRAKNFPSVCLWVFSLYSPSSYSFANYNVIPSSSTCTLCQGSTPPPPFGNHSLRGFKERTCRGFAYFQSIHSWINHGNGWILFRIAFAKQYYFAGEFKFCQPYAFSIPFCAFLPLPPLCWHTTEHTTSVQMDPSSRVGNTFAHLPSAATPPFPRKESVGGWGTNVYTERRGAISNEYDKPCASNPSPSTFDWPSTQQVEYFLNATGLGWLGEERREEGVELGGGENESAISREDESVLC